MRGPAPIPLTDGRYTVPGNRWDLVADMTPPHRSVAVIIPYYNQQAELDLTLAALEQQDYPKHLIEVVVADDGSTQSPVVKSSTLRCTVVRQDDRGFRAAAARNLGAAGSAAEILCFLDADTVPERDYIGHLVQLPSLVPDALVVGRRRHADLSGWTPERLSQWWSGGSRPRELPEPGWLADGYTRSADLLRLDHRSYRYVISSVMCCGRELFEDVGGFDESFVGYGGEDWEFAHRALACGAVLHHARRAVAWHNGPDWALRPISERAAAKNAEALAVARLVSDPDARRHGLRYDIPDVAVEIDAECHGPGSLVTTMACFLHLDVGIWIDDADDRLFSSLRLDDPRIRPGRVPERIRKRCRHVITVTGRATLPRSSVSEIIDRCGQDGIGSVHVSTGDVAVHCRTSWVMNRERRWAAGPVRLRDPKASAELGTAVQLSGDVLQLSEIARDADVSW